MKCGGDGEVWLFSPRFTMAFTRGVATAKDKFAFSCAEAFEVLADGGVGRCQRFNCAALQRDDPGRCNRIATGIAEACTCKHHEVSGTDEADRWTRAVAAVMDDEFAGQHKEIAAGGVAAGKKGLLGPDRNAICLAGGGESGDSVSSRDDSGWSKG